MIHRDPRFFAEPQEFRPERWEGNLAARLPKYAYFPFGGGQRHCIGKDFAMLQIVLTLATIARKFQFRLASSGAVSREASIILRPKAGVRVVVEERRRLAALGDPSFCKPRCGLAACG